MKKIIFLFVLIFIGCSTETTTTPTFDSDYQYLDSEYLSSSSHIIMDANITLEGSCNLIASDITNITDANYNHEEFCVAYENELKKLGMIKSDFKFCLNYKNCL